MENVSKRSNTNHDAEHSSHSNKRYKTSIKDELVCPYKTAVESSKEELVCPLTLEPPLDPVTAEDGKVYEGTAIKEHMSKNSFDLKSPITNEPMGMRLFPAFQVLKVIEQLDVGPGASTKRYKKAIDSSADELVCPLTLQLPLDPVTAEDFCVYERKAIEERISTNRFDLKSPITNKPMGTRVFPAFQVRNVIEQLVRSGAVQGDKANRWNGELMKRKMVELLQRGEISAIYSLGVRHYLLREFDSPAAIAPESR